MECKAKQEKKDKPVLEIKLLSLLDESIINADQEGWIDEEEIIKQFENKYIDN